MTMRSRLGPLLLVPMAVLGGTGCYQRHDAAVGSTASDAGVVVRDDAAVTRFDAAIDAALTPDAGPGRDAGPPLPREPEPDPGAGGRPSEGTDTGDWEDPPALGDDDDCCVLGEPVAIPHFLDREDIGAARLEPLPRVGWGAGEWGLGFSYEIIPRVPAMSPFLPKLGFQRVARDGSPIGRYAEIDSAPVGDRTYAVIQSVRWAAGRWAIPIVAAPTEGGLRAAHVHLVDGASHPVALVALEPAFDGGLDVAYVAHGDRWLGFGANGEVARGQVLDELEGAGAPVELDVGPATWLRAASLSSRVAVVHGAGNLLRSGSVGVAVVDPDLAILGRVALPSSPIHQAAAARVRDLAAAVIEDRERLTVQMVDPFTMAVASERTVVAEGAIRSVDAIGADKHGVLGVCWTRAVTDGRREDHEVLFRLVGPDGRPRGRPVTIANGIFRGPAPNCSVGSDAAGFLVVWWEASELWVRRVEIAR